MSEIEKMYENAGIEKVKDYYCPNCETKLEDWVGKHKGYICPNERCDYALCDAEEDFQECLEHLSYREKYPPFTAEKQLSLMAFLINRKVGLSFKTEQGEITIEAISRGLAGIVNRIWQDLTEEEKQQVKGILE